MCPKAAARHFCSHSASMACAAALGAQIWSCGRLWCALQDVCPHSRSANAHEAQQQACARTAHMHRAPKRMRASPNFSQCAH